MNITPLIPDGFNGQVKQLICQICKHIFYLTMPDYHRLGDISYCHECSLILISELEKTQEGPKRIQVQQEMVSQPPLPLQSKPISSRPSVRVPQPRTLEREKMTIEQLLEEAKMLSKTWRYEAALDSYEQALQRDPRCIAALYDKGKTLKHLDRPTEALTVYDEILQLDSSSAQTYEAKGWTLITLRDYEEALTTFDCALQMIYHHIRPHLARILFILISISIIGKSIASSPALVQNALLPQ